MAIDEGSVHLEALLSVFTYLCCFISLRLIENSVKQRAVNK